MPGAALPVLDHDPYVRRVPGKMSGDLTAAMAYYDDQLSRAELPGGGQHVIEHARTTDRVQHLRELGFHPRSRARGKNDDSGRPAHSHVAVLLDWLLRGWPAPCPGLGQDRSRGADETVHMPDSRRIPSGNTVRGRTPPA